MTMTPLVFTVFGHILSKRLGCFSTFCLSAQLAPSFVHSFVHSFLQCFRNWGLSLMLQI